MSFWTIAWIAWLVLTIGGFIALEVVALVRKNDRDLDPDTLSDHLTKWFSVKTRTGRIVWTVVCIILAVVLAWLWPHILFNQTVI